MQAQNGVAISTSSSATPDASAILDVQSTTQGMLIPRVDISDLSTAAPVSSPATSLMVYNSNTTTGPGFFYWDGSANAWVTLGGAKKLDDLSDVKTVTGTAGGLAVTSYYFGLNGPTSPTGNLNIGIGDYALSSATSASENTAIGSFALDGLTTGSYNIALGEGAGDHLATGDYNIILGRGIDVSSTSASNELNIGKTIYATGIYTTSAKVGIGNGNNAPKSTLDVKGSVSLPYASGGTTTLTDTNYTYLINVDGDTVTLPDATNIAGRVYIIKLLTSFTPATATVATTSSQQIDGATSHTLNQSSTKAEYIKVQSTGSNWIIIGQN